MKKNFTRRSFIQTSAVGLAGFTFFPLLNSCKQFGVNDTIRLGFIGLGQQTRYLINGFNLLAGVKVVAGSDVYGIKRERFEKTVKEFQREKEETVEVKTYENYQDILERQDIDAVVIVTPDHWHAIQTLDACRAGKDIYIEKPLAFTIKEGVAITNAVKNSDIILGVGSQQRSDPRFQHAVKLVRDGKLGKINRINAFVGPPPRPFDLTEETIPYDLDWEKWLGPNPFVHYNHRLNPPVSLDPVQNETFWAEWRYFKETGGGFLTDWGAHNFDIAQWAMNRDNSGPVKVIPAGVNGEDYIRFIYDDGIVMANEPYNEEHTRGVKFWGEDGWVEICRANYKASDPSFLPVADDQAEEVPYETGIAHLVDFIESMRSRRQPIAPVEAGHRSGTIGILGNIATNLNISLDWDPVEQRFPNDDEANLQLHREYREGYKLQA